MINKCELSAPQNDIGYLIWNILKFWQRGKHRILDEFGITASQLEVMGATYKYNHIQEPQEVTQVLLSQETNIDPMTISTILRNLQKKGLIVRTESPTDTRARVVKLTDEGTELFEKAIAKVKEKQEYLFRKLDKDALRKQLQILLNELNNQHKEIDNQ